jgi:hypothetical protein
VNSESFPGSESFLMAICGKREVYLQAQGHNVDLIDALICNMDLERSLRMVKIKDRREHTCIARSQSHESHYVKRFH